VISNLFRPEYQLPNFFNFKPHGRRTIQLWNGIDLSIARRKKAKMMLRHDADRILANHY